MIQHYETLFDALQAVRNFTIDKPEECPATIFEMLRAQTAELVAWQNTLGAIYDAPRGGGSETTVGPILLNIAAGALGVFAVSNFFSRGSLSARQRLALMRDAGEDAPDGMTWPDAADDPAGTPAVPVPTPPADIPPIP
ncbi:hypothetical protein QH494_02465 [Sphingomonas sp. AR_OL41]|uniref:hypothetical protein n=1 Tax=Sphingomonas sp. AR_OL41 TaxID=3042729 RepID=UPI002481418A|nr:hypothetical protein [Sphingomonas sp. AR_OL41]MDH7971032.1 hypothetical protein [Sphingomonas sp. AR_OL41]